MRNATAVRLVFAIVSVTLMSGVGPALAEDCNNNGIDDPCDVDCELAACGIPGCGQSPDCNGNRIPDECDVACPFRDIVFILDTSVSMTEIPELCPALQKVVQDLADSPFAVRAVLLGITQNPPPTCGGFSGMVGSVVGLLDDTVPGDPGDCSVTDAESWGNATAIVSERFAWRLQAARLVVTMGDEGPCEGDPCEDPGEDRDSIDNAIAVAGRSGVTVFSITGLEPNQCAIQLADALADGTGGEAFHLSAGLSFDELPFELTAAIRAHVSRCNDCNANDNPDDCDIARGSSEDCSGNGIPDDCEPDCNCNGVADSCDIMSGTCRDADGNGRPDECDASDCNENRFLDSCDISRGDSEDCTENGIPDECEPDCNDNEIADSCDIAHGASVDCLPNGVPDECEPDCNDNGVADNCDIAGGASSDCQPNGVPDECEPDCQPEGIPGHGIPDSCDIAAGTSSDCQVNGIPDECEVPPLCPWCSDCGNNGIPDNCELGACCDFDYSGGTCRDSRTRCECDGPQDAWVEGAVCKEIEFDPPCRNACCCMGGVEGTCQNLTREACGVGGGLWRPGTTCSADGCPWCSCVLWATLRDPCGSDCTYAHQNRCVMGDRHGDICTGNLQCPGGTCAGGCDDPRCCTAVCGQDSFCCLVGWDEQCAERVAVSCDLPPANDECTCARTIEVPSATSSDNLHATQSPTDPGFCCHTTRPGGKGYGTVWYKFVATESSVELRTCLSNAPALDSLLQVFAAGDDSTDESSCCSLVPIGCSDDVALCSSSNANSRLCITDLVIGQTYYVLLASKGEPNPSGDVFAVTYRLDVRSPCTGPAPVVCPGVTFLDPPSGVVDARQPHPPTDAGNRQGIDTLLVQGLPGTDDPARWSLCETKTQDGLPNAVTSVLDNGDDTFTVRLDRPISIGAVTAVTYTDGYGVPYTGTFTSHPANVDAGTASSAIDILAIIDVLNGQVRAPWCRYSADVDHSGVAAAADILRVIDLLNGADEYEPWLGVRRPEIAPPCLLP